MKFIVGISGASGATYGLRLVEELIKAGGDIYLCVSTQAFSIIKTETGVDWYAKTNSQTEKKIQKYYSSKKIRYFNNNDLAAPISSGSFLTDGMFVVPCSMKTLSGIANGYACSLIERAADVVLKEGRTLVVSPREMPFSAIHLENMLKLARMGARIVPPIPAFYYKPKDINDIINFVVGKILDSVGIKHHLFERWGIL
jgi:4-hydroxy-3-polyprenylbenzoate decarboxylase